MEACHQLGLGFGEIEGRPVGLGDAGHKKANKSHKLGKDVPAGEKARPGTALPGDDFAQRESPGQQQHTDYGKSQSQLVADHLGGTAQAAQERILAVGRPTGQDNPVHAQRGDSQHEEQPDVDVGNVEAGASAQQLKFFRPEWNHGHRQQRQCEREKRREQVYETAGDVGQDDVFFEQELEPISEGLQQSVRAHAVGAPAGLNVRNQLAFKPDHISNCGQQHKDQDPGLQACDQQLGMATNPFAHRRDRGRSRSETEFNAALYRPRVPEVNNESSAENTRPGGVSAAACPLVGAQRTACPAKSWAWETL